MVKNNRTKRTGIVWLVGLLALSACGTSSSPPAGPGRAGPHPDGTAVLPTGYAGTPAREPTRWGALPWGCAASPDGRWLVVSNEGQGAQSLQVIDSATGTVTQTVSYRKPEA